MNLGNYSEALEQQVRALILLRTNQGRERLFAHWDQTPRQLAEGEFSGMEQAIGRAETLFVGRSICDMLAAVVAQGVPSLMLREEELFARYGWCWFNQNPGYRDERDANAILRALSWGVFTMNHVVRNGRDMTLVTVERAPDALDSWRALVFHPWYSHRDRPSLRLPWASTVWPMGKANDDVGENTAIGEPMSAAQKQDVRFLGDLFAALVLFIQQRILTTPHERAERHAIKRIEREGWTHEPLIRVVQLRRSESAHRERDGEAEPVDWSCRWIVRGHWRQQACGEGHKERKPIWVLPHTKGPENKPLKPPRATIFAVVR